MSFWEGFRAGWNAGVGIGEALNAREIRKTIADAQAKAAEEAARSGRRVELLPEDQIRQGFGVTTASGDYVTRDKDTADMIATEKKQLPGYGIVSQIPPMSAEDIFNRKYAPAIVEKLMAQNRFQEAEAFQKWLQNRQNQRYGTLWMEAMNARMMGDLTGAAEKLQALYNLQVPDGQYAVLMPDKDGSFTVQIRDNETNQVNRQFKGSLDNIVDMGLGVLSPQARVEALFRGRQKEDAKVFVIPPGGALVSDGQVLYERPYNAKEPRWEKPAINPETGKRQAWRRLPDGSYEWSPGIYEEPEKEPTVIIHRSDRAGSGGGGRSGRVKSSDPDNSGDIKLTLAQQRHNIEVEDARRRVKMYVDAGLNVTERAKIDPEMAKLLEKANRRKYGEFGERPMLRDTRPLVEWARGRDPNDVRERALKKGWRPDEIEEAINKAQ